ncbi:unnamed protein product [Leptosia nina]|uniref:Breast cancer type 1 susceptibility protein homolog n=1 Tax=Leptosia nina TaxID=320188 RepID=A0AAV1ITU2_9NEOP
MEKLLQQVDKNSISKILSQQVYQVTCLECCKYYIVPTTATCNHTLCHNCWYGRHTCPTCGMKIDRKKLRNNLPLQSLTDHIHNLVDAFKDLFNIDLDEGPAMNLEICETIKTDPNVNVNKWLGNSQNCFSASISTQMSPSIDVPVKATEIQVPSETIKPLKNSLLDQQDWDKIEELPDSEDIFNKDKENIIGPMDIEPYSNILIIDEDKEYSTENPRRSSRKKEPESNMKLRQQKSLTKDNEANKNWANVKKMKKEFGNVKKKEMNKLNVSIEMCQEVKDNKNKTNTTIHDDSRKWAITNENYLSPQYGNKQLQATEAELQKEVIENLHISGNKNVAEENFIKDNIPNKDTKINTVLSQNNSNTNIELVTKPLLSEGNEERIKKANSVTFYKKSACNSQVYSKPEKYEQKPIIDRSDNNDIEIIVKIGNTAANICIKQKDKYGKNKISVSTSPIIVTQEKENVECLDKSIQVNFEEFNTQKTISDKKNTSSADTSTVKTGTKQSFPQKIVDIREIEDNQNVYKTDTGMINVNAEEELNDLDIFDSESVKEGQMQYLKKTETTTSAIFMPTNVSKLKTQLNTLKRVKPNGDDDSQSSKRCKLAVVESKQRDIQRTHQDSKLCNYNDIMDQVFANIDADIQGGDKNIPKNISIVSNTNENIQTSYGPQKYSENLFSLAENDLEGVARHGKPNTIIESTQRKPIGMLSQNPKVQPEICNTDLNVEDLSTPQHDDDMDVVEETPQKEVSRTRSKRSDTVMAQKVINNSTHASNANNEPEDATKETSINRTVIHLETPNSMRKFISQAQYKSTPLAKKSLNFTNDRDHTSYSPFVVARNTQEKEIMCKAFEQVNSPIEKKRFRKYCLAVSCLNQHEKNIVKNLCSLRNWTFEEQYTKDLTHLIVNVNEDNLAQRSVKYMQAVANSKWIVSYEWVERCLSDKEILDEEAFEVLDTTGEPGPRRSRLAKQKLFTGIKFFCMPPFSVIDIDVFKELLIAAGGEVVEESHQIKATETPSLLLAEMENTQEDRFIYLSMHLGVVPVNFEWALNSLGSYTLCSIMGQLLCPSTLLPSVIAQWPLALITQDDDSNLQ